jgi:hypothetical protein
MPGCSLSKVFVPWGIWVTGDWLGKDALYACVVGPDGALCDGLETALMVDVRDVQGWMGARAD